MTESQHIEDRRQTDKVLFESLKEQGDQLNKLEVDFGKVEANQKAIFAALENVSREVRSLASHIGSHKTPWGILISAMGLLLAIITTIGVGFVGNPMKDIKINQVKVHNTLVEHVRDGHPEVVKELFNMKVLVIERQLEQIKIEQDRQREWIFEHHGEAHEVVAEFRATKSEMTRRVEKLTESVSGHASYEERLRSLERAAFPVTSYRDGRPGG